MPSPYERHNTFHPIDIIDERVLRHGGQVEDHHVSQCHSRVQVAHRDRGALSLITDLTRVQHGYFHSAPAALIGFRFQFLGSTAHRRFQKADVKITFSPPDAEQAVNENSPEMDPVVVDFGPKHLASEGTEEKRNCEDPRQHDGLPLRFDAAVIVRYSSSFSAAVDVKIGPVFDLLARPFPAAEPVVFQPGIDYGDSIRVGAVDFESLTQDEWRRVITPDLDFGHAVLNSTAPPKKDG